MGQVHILLVAFFAVVPARGHDISHLKEIQSTDERQSKQDCPAYYQKNAQVEIIKVNYDCIFLCHYTGYSITDFILKKSDFTSCGGDYGGGNNLCVNGKCFQSYCVNRCKDSGNFRTLTNIRVDTTANLVYCDYDGVINSNGFPSYGPCEEPNQIDFYGANTNGERNDDNRTSDVFLTHFVNLDDVCKKLYGDGASGKKWNNGCNFRCVNKHNVLFPIRYIQPNGWDCATNYQCFFSKCLSNTCIKTCNSDAKGNTLLDIIQEDDESDKVECYFTGRSNSITLQSPLKCEASSSDAGGGGKSPNENIRNKSNNVSGYNGNVSGGSNNTSVNITGGSHNSYANITGGSNNTYTGGSNNTYENNTNVVAGSISVSNK